VTIPEPASSINVGLLKRQLVYYRCTAYDTEVKNALAAARDWIVEQAGRVDHPAIVLDIDETSLSNWEQIHHNDFAYVPSGACDLKSGSACGQREWELSASATAIAPTLELFNVAKALKGRDGSPVAIFFVTGRFDDPFERLATEWNLRRVGYEGWQGLVLRPDATRGNLVSEYKKAARADIEDRQGFTIIANIGDQISDLVGGHAQRCFKVPNPFYFLDGEPPPAGGLTCTGRAGLRSAAYDPERTLAGRRRVKLAARAASGLPRPRRKGEGRGTTAAVQARLLRVDGARWSLDASSELCVLAT
jgi:acid phosphatase